MNDGVNDGDVGPWSPLNDEWSFILNVKIQDDVNPAIQRNIRHSKGTVLKEDSRTNVSWLFLREARLEITERQTERGRDRQRKRGKEGEHEGWRDTV